jgi:hypothetical protein
VSSVPGDHNDIVLCGVVLGTHVAGHKIAGVLLRVNASSEGDPLVIVIVPEKVLPAHFTPRGDRLWIRGCLCSNPSPEKKALHFVLARHLDVTKSVNSTTMMAGKGGPP